MDYASKITESVKQALIWAINRRSWLWITLSILLALAVAGAKKREYNNKLEHFFPQRSLSGNMYQVMTKSKFSDQIQLEIDTGKQGGALEVLQEAEKLAEQLRLMPEVETVDFQFEAESAVIWEELATLLPLLAEASILSEADLPAAARRARQAMLLPGMPLRMLQFDPFGWSGAHLRQLQNLQQLSGMQLSLQHPFPTDPETRRLLLNLQVTVPPPANAAAINQLRQQILSLSSTLLPAAKIAIFSPLLHTAENEITVRRDIFRLSLASMLGLLILFLFFYGRSFDAVWVPLLPFASSLLATGLLALFFQDICLLVLGICGSIAGLAVDQGIHIYTAFAGSGRLDKLSALFAPLAMSAMTSAAVFFMLNFSGISAYQQLGFFAGCVLLINFTLSFFLLPTLLRQRRRLHFQLSPFSPRPSAALMVVMGWLLLCLGAIIMLPKTQFDFDLASLDGTSRATLRAERDFQQRWRGNEASSMIVVTGQNEEEIQQTCELLATDFFPAADCFHTASLWPSQAQRAANLRSWQSPEVLPRLAAMESTLSQECQQAGLPASLHAPFFQSLRAGIDAGLSSPEPRLFRSITGRLLRRQHHSLTGIFFVSVPLADSAHLSLLQSLDRLGNCALLSGASFRLAAGSDLRPIMRKVLVLAFVVVLFLLLPIYRSLFKLILISLPGLTAVLLYIGLMSLSGTAINLAGCFGMIILIGLVIDYGIFALHHGTTKDLSTIPTAIFLSAATTLFTSGALLLSHHPVLFHTGLVIFVEILLAMLTSLYVIPALLVLLRWRRACLPMALLCFCALLGSGCRGLSSTSASLPALSATEASRQWHSFQEAHNSSKAQLWSMRVDIWWRSFTMLLAVRHEQQERRLNASGMSPAGAQLFAVAGKNGLQHSYYVAPIFPAIAQKKIFHSIYDDLSNIFFLERPEFSFPSSVPLPFRLRLLTGEILVLSESPLQLTQKRLGIFPNRQWIVYYGKWDCELRSYTEIIYQNHRTGCTFTLRPMAAKQPEPP